MALPCLYTASESTSASGGSGESIVTQPSLEIPHPRLHLRRFVLVPLAEIDPGAVHPVLRLTVAELLARCPDVSRVSRVAGPEAVDA